MYKETDIELLIATRNRDSLDFLLSMFSFSNFHDFRILIINQTEKQRLLFSDYSNVRVINSFDIGLSKSRNLALDNAQGKILVIADDDVIYQQGFVSKILASYAEFPQAAVINFSAVKPNGTFLKKYPSVSKTEMNNFDILQVSSIEMSLNKRILDTVGIRFDENFGLGSTFELGEEAVFLFDLKKKGKQITFDPHIIVEHEALTTSNKKSIKELYYIQGALFSRIFKNKAIFWLFAKLLFDLKQHKLRFEDLSSVFKSAKNGYSKFVRIQNENKRK
jgi:glycosyltransferase involved in cell wall biosynthesis